MSKNAIRKDKTCLNCRHVVDQRYCPHCGQENTHTRHTFHHLFVHFFEDLTHYENAFWKTIQNLLFKPAALTKEYLSGKRLSYLAPVRLYIFISFVTFLFISLFTTNGGDKRVFDELAKKEKLDSIENIIAKADKISLKKLDSGKVAYNELKKKKINLVNVGYTSLKELDSVRKYSKTAEINDFEYYLNKKAIEINTKYSNDEIIDKFIESFEHNLPKVLFIYMPLFAFFLWLIHNKKKYYYFDHGIFTLHYFSFLLLIILLLFIVTKLSSLLEPSKILSFCISTINFVAAGWMFYYFFPAHKRFYGESNIKSFIKSTILFIINMFLILTLLVIFAIYTFINIH
jgi:G:T/U-mismatch repair DNA glycosylase